MPTGSKLHKKAPQPMAGGLEEARIRKILDQPKVQDRTPTEFTVTVAAL
jgi:hypothetical protein